MENPAPKPKSAPVIAAPPPPPPPTPEQLEEQRTRLAADAARADMSKFRYLGYLTSKDNTLFLSKDGETFIVRSGDRLQASYQVKEAGKDYVILLDTATRVEVRVELSGGEAQSPQPQPGMPRFR